MEVTMCTEVIRKFQAAMLIGLLAGAEVRQVRFIASSIDGSDLQPSVAKRASKANGDSVPTRSATIQSAIPDSDFAQQANRLAEQMEAMMDDLALLEHEAFALVHRWEAGERERSKSHHSLQKDDQLISEIMVPMRARLDAASIPALEMGSREEGTWRALKSRGRLGESPADRMVDILFSHGRAQSMSSRFKTGVDQTASGKLGVRSAKSSRDSNGYIPTRAGEGSHAQASLFEDSHLTICADNLHAADCAKEVGTTSVFRTSANVVKAIVGAGILTMSWTFYESTMLPSVAATLFFGWLSAVNFFFLGLCSEKTGAASYGEIWSKCFGKRSSIIADLAIATLCFANCAGYLIVAGDYIPRGLKGLGCNLRIFQVRQNAIMLVFAMIAPLSFLKNLSVLGYTSIIGTLAAIYTCGMLSVEGVKAGLHASDWKFCGLKPGWLLMVPAVAISFAGHFIAPQGYQELEQRSPKRWMTVTTLSFAISMFITLACGVSGYVMLGSSLGASSNVLNAPRFEGAMTAVIAYIATTLSVSLSYPLNAHGLRNSIESIFLSVPYLFPGVVENCAFKSLPSLSPDLRRNVLSLVCTLLTLGTALKTDSLGLMNALNGAVSGCLLALVFPALMYLKCTEEDGSNTCMTRWLSWISIISGSTAAVTGTWMTLQWAIESNNR